MAGALPAAALGFAVVAPVRVLIGASGEEQWVRRSYEVRSQIQVVHRLVLQAQAAMRGHRLASGVDLRGPFVEARQAITPALDRLGQLVLDDGEQSGCWHADGDGHGDGRLGLLGGGGGGHLHGHVDDGGGQDAGGDLRQRQREL